MITFVDARQRVANRWPDYEIAQRGYETDAHWILLLLPETVGGRIPIVAKRGGAIRWINEDADEYSQERPVEGVDVASALREEFDGCWRCGNDQVTYHQVHECP